MSKSISGNTTSGAVTGARTRANVKANKIKQRRIKQQRNKRGRNKQLSIINPPKIRKKYLDEYFGNIIDNDIDIKDEKELYKYIFRCLIIIILFICLLAYYNKDNLTFIKI